VAETNEERIARLEQSGDLDPACLTCLREFYPVLRETGKLPFAPSHKASKRCESGKYAHCTCDTCF
jgi:hypothetical protein